MLKNIFIVFAFIFYLISCKTIIPKDDSPLVQDNKVIKEDPNKAKVIASYGQDNEVQAVEINNKTYYIIGGKNVEKMSEEEIKTYSLTSPLKITEENVKGYNGIVIAYYDIKIFLSKKSSSGAIVGLFEPQRNDWSLGNDNDRSQSIQIKLQKYTAGPITINKRSISLAFQ